MINDWFVWVWWVGESTLSLEIVVYILLISILERCDSGCADHLVLLWHQWLHSLKVISGHDFDVIGIEQLIRVLLKSFVKSNEWVVQVRLSLGSGHN